MRLLTLTAIGLSLVGCTSGNNITPQNWSCTALVPEIIRMSKEKDVKILEITHVEEISKFYGDRLSCHTKSLRV